MKSNQKGSSEIGAVIAVIIIIFLCIMWYHVGLYEGHEEYYLKQVVCTTLENEEIWCRPTELGKASK